MVELIGKPICVLVSPDANEVDVSLLLRFDDPVPDLVCGGWSDGGEAAYWICGRRLRDGKVVMMLPIHLFEQNAQVVLKVGPAGGAEAVDWHTMPTFWTGVFQAGMREGEPGLTMVC